MPVLDGYVHPDFADVAAELLDMIPRYEPGGAAVCVYHAGRPVVDVWGGTRDDAGSPWLEHTTAPSFSTTKGIMSTLLHILVDRGLATYEDPVADHWPAFACEGKETIRIRHVLCHEAGLYRMSEIASRPQEMLDWDHMVARVAAARPAHAPGEQHGYHALTYGWLVGGLVEAISGRDLQTLLHEELVEPLRLDGAFIGMPEAELHRRARLIHDDGVMHPRQSSTSGWRAGLRRGTEAVMRAMGMDMNEFRAALMPFAEPFDWNAEETVRAMIPAANGQFTARSLARVYAMYAEGGKLDGVRILSRRAVAGIGAVQNRTRDKVLFLPMHWRLGFHRVFTFRARAPDGFGHFGYGGSGAWCDPVRRVSCALTLNSGVGTPVGDLRIARLTRVVLNAADRVR
ncbi:MAG TPA: serine hydrolase domain-containing protein [Pseudomonadales bacterium]|nr:serine hydrolase domain-containing protein [Pseudomonadales bacterium]